MCNVVMSKLIRLSMNTGFTDTVHGYLILSKGNMYITSERFRASVFPDSWTDKQLEDKMVLLLESTSKHRTITNVKYSVTHVIDYE